MPAPSLNYLMHELVVIRAVRIANSFNKMIRPYKARSTFHTVPFYCCFVRTVAPLNYSTVLRCEKRHTTLASTVTHALSVIPKVKQRDG